MFRVVSFVAVSMFTGLVITGCASYQGSSGSIGASNSAKKASGKNCRKLSKALRRLEQKRDVGSKKYDKLLNKYINSNCHS